MKGVWVLVLVALLVGESPRSGASQAAGPLEFHRWADSIPLDQRVVQELQRFPAEEVLGRDLFSGFAQAVRARVFEAAGDQAVTLSKGPCEPSIDVKIGDTDFPELGGGDGEGRASDDRWEDFLGSLIRTEMVACLETDRNPGTVLRHYLSPL